MPRRMKGGIELGKGSFGSFNFPSFKSKPRIYKDFSSGKTWTFQEGPIKKLRKMYGNISDKDIEIKAAEDGDGNYLKGLKFKNLAGAFPPYSTLVGAYFREGKINLHLPVFFTKMIEGQEEGAFWTFEDGSVSRTVGNNWINVKPMGTPESPKIDPTTGVYVFEWASNFGDAATRTGLGVADVAGHIGEGAIDGYVGNTYAYGLNPSIFGSFAPRLKRGFVETKEHKEMMKKMREAVEGGKRTKKRKMNKKKKTLRKKNKRKTLKGGKRRKSKNFKRTRK